MTLYLVHFILYLVFIALLVGLKIVDDGLAERGIVGLIMRMGSNALIAVAVEWVVDYALMFVTKMVFTDDVRVLYIIEGVSVLVHILIMVICCYFITNTADCIYMGVKTIIFPTVFTLVAIAFAVYKTMQIAAIDFDSLMKDASIVGAVSTLDDFSILYTIQGVLNMIPLVVYMICVIVGRKRNY